MKKNLPTETKNSQVSLHRSKSLLMITDDILGSTNYEWMYQLWDWADENNLSENIIPRIKEELLSLSNLDFGFGDYINNLPNEIINLKKIKKINLINNTNLILTKKQSQWIQDLISRYGIGYDKINIDYNLLDRTYENIDKLWKWADEHEISNYTIPRYDYHGLVSLQNLDLSDKYLVSLPQEITLLSNLKKLDLIMNKSLVLSKNQIGWIFQLKMNFCSINMDDGLLYRTSNREESMDTWIIRLWEWATTHNIQNWLQIEHGLEVSSPLNPIVLPFNEIALIHLSELDLDGCKLNSLPEEIGQLTNLTKLNLSENSLVSLPSTITNLSNLTELNIWNNPHLALARKEKEWILDLQKNGCRVEMDYNLHDQIKTYNTAYQI